MFEIKKYKIDSEKKGIKGWVQSSHGRRTLISTMVGAIAGFGYFYFSEGQYMSPIGIDNVLKSLAIGGFFGFFITNSPCTRGHC